jgi:hypothetical protein
MTQTGRKKDRDNEAVHGMSVTSVSDQKLSGNQEGNEWNGTQTRDGNNNGKDDDKEEIPSWRRIRARQRTLMNPPPRDRRIHEIPMV